MDKGLGWIWHCSLFRRSSNAETDEDAKMQKSIAARSSLASHVSLVLPLLHALSIPLLPFLPFANVVLGLLSSTRGHAALTYRTFPRANGVLLSV